MQTIGGYDEELVEQSSKDYECPVCLLLLRDPHLTQCCGSHFCESCIKPIALADRKCPMCKQEIETVMLNKRMQRAVGDLKIFCPKKVEGCHWTGELRYKQHHLDQQCQFVLVQCKYDCGQQVLRSEYQDHLQDICAKRPLEVQLVSMSHMFGGKIKQLEEEVTATKNEHRASVKSLEEKLALQMEENAILKQHLRNQNDLMETLHNAIIIHSEKLTAGQKELEKTNDQIAILQSQLFGPMPIALAEKPLGTNPRGSGDNSTPDDPLLGSIESGGTIIETAVSGMSPSSLSCQVEQTSLSDTFVHTPVLPQLQEELDTLGIQIGLLRESHWKFKEQSSQRLRAVTNELATHYQLMQKLDQPSNSVLPPVPIWEEGSDLTTNCPIPPFEFTMSGVSKHLMQKDQWFGSGFYTAPGGYKMCVRVDMFGAGDGKGTHVSVYFYLMKGEFDNKLRWPMRANIIIQILNWMEDRYHIHESVRFFDDLGDVCSRVMTGSRAKVGRGRHQFISHSVLKTKEKNVQYVFNDCLRFRVEQADVMGFSSEEIHKFPVWEKDRLVPCEFTLTQFAHHKSLNVSWYSPPFYTHHAGYKFCLRIDANGDQQERQSHVSMYVSLMKGEYDDHLRWPFRGEVIVQLLNWLEDKNHIEERIRFSQQAGDQVCHRVTVGTKAKVGRGRNQFIAHTDMGHNPGENTQYLFEDCMRFRVKNVTV